MNALAIYKSKELQLPKLIDYAVRDRQEVVLMLMISLLLGPIMEKLKPEDWILIKL
jgi:hypothetical protein